MWYDLQADYPLGRLVEFGTAFCPSMHAGQAGDWAVALQRDFHLCSGPDLASGWRDLVRVGCWVFGGRGVGIGCLLDGGGLEGVFVSFLTRCCRA